MIGLFRRKGKAVPPAVGDTEAPPSTYAQWSACLERLERGEEDEQCLVELSSGQLSWTGGVAPLFIERLSGEVQRRLSLCSTRLTRDLKAGVHESHWVRALLQARQQLGFVHRLCALPVVPESTRAQLADQVRKFAERSQRSLEESARADRSGRLLSLLRHNPLTRFETAVPETVAPTEARGRRQILL